LQEAFSYWGGEKVECGGDGDGYCEVEDESRYDCVALPRLVTLLMVYRNVPCQRYGDTRVLNEQGYADGN